MMARNEDRFANILMAQVVMSAANTITFKEILTGISLGMGIGMLIDQIDYHVPRATVAELLTTVDTLHIGFTVSDGLVDLSADDRQVIHMTELAQTLTTSGVVQVVSPLSHQFFPPIIRAAPRLFLACNTAGFASAATVQARMYFRYIDLSTQEYLELAETGLVIG